MLDVDALYRRHAEDLRRALRRRFDSLVPEALIEDACSATWLIAWKKRDQVQDDNPRGWLYTVALHEVLALLRKRRLEATGEPADCPDGRTSSTVFGRP